jgi:hypothetical protein
MITGATIVCSRDCVSCWGQRCTRTAKDPAETPLGTPLWRTRGIYPVHERCSIRNLLPQKNCYVSDTLVHMRVRLCRPQTLIGCLVCEIKWPIIISLFSLVFCLICGKNKLIHHHPIPHKANKIVHYEEWCYSNIFDEWIHDASLQTKHSVIARLLHILTVSICIIKSF